MKNIFIAIIVIVMLPLLFVSISEKESSQELKGLTERDIQFLESIGFVNNLDGSFTVTISGLTSFAIPYEFEFQPTSIHGKVSSIRVTASSRIDISIGYFVIGQTGGTMTLWGGDVS